MDIKPDPYRYVNWVLYFLAASINSIPSQAFSGISPIIKDLYGVGELQSNIGGIIFPVSYVITLLPVNYLIDKKGLKLSTLFCETCMISGLLVRLLININFYLFYLGTFICSLGFVIMISGANKFANTWFPHQQIFFVSSVCVFGVFASDAIGTFFSSYYIREQSNQDDVFNFFLWESLVMIGINLLMVLFFKGKPKTPQNYASTAERAQFKQDLRSILKNRNYIVLFITMSFVFCTLTLVFVFLPWITKIYNYRAIYNGYIIVCANAAGLFGCIIIGLIGKAMTYKRKCIVLMIPQLIFMGGIWLSLEWNAPAFSCVCGACFGFFCYPFLTTLTDFSTQTTFPVGEATSSGILLFGGQTAGVILSVFFSFIFDGEDLGLTRLLNVIILLLLLGAIISLLFAKEELKREDYQNSKEKQSLIESHEQF